MGWLCKPSEETREGGGDGIKGNGSKGDENRVGGQKWSIEENKRGDKLKKRRRGGEGRREIIKNWGRKVECRNWTKTLTTERKPTGFGGYGMMLMSSSLMEHGNNNTPVHRWSHTWSLSTWDTLTDTHTSIELTSSHLETQMRTQIITHAHVRELLSLFFVSHPSFNVHPAALMLP